MPRYFIELSYKGTRYSGFQTQENALTVQEEVEKAFAVLHREPVQLTGSSRTDAGVHAKQNYFHFDFDRPVHPQFVYKMNAILPPDIVIHRVLETGPEAHARFDALSRVYEYSLYHFKDPFLADRAYYFPYRINLERMQEAAALLIQYTDFTSFSKRNTQVKTFQCRILLSEWVKREQCLVYRVEANRFLRGMVRGLTGTMLRVGTGKLSLDDFAAIIEARDCTRADFSVPAHGLTLLQVKYKDLPV